MGAGPTTQDPRSPSFEHHLEPVTEMALEDLLCRSFHGPLPEECQKSFQPFLLGAEEFHDGARLGDQLRVPSEVVEVLPIPYQSDYGSGVGVEEISAPERRSSGQGGEHLPIEPGKFHLVPATGNDIGKPHLHPQRRRALFVRIQDEITQQDSGYSLQVGQPMSRKLRRDRNGRPGPRNVHPVEVAPVKERPPEERIERIPLSEYEEAKWAVVLDRLSDKRLKSAPTYFHLTLQHRSRVVWPENVDRDWLKRRLLANLTGTGTGNSEGIGGIRHSPHSHERPQDHAPSTQDEQDHEQTDGDHRVGRPAEASLHKTRERPEQHKREHQKQDSDDDE